MVKFLLVEDTMPAPSETAKRLAMDLKEVGALYGYISTVEHPPIEGSSLKIDVVWEIKNDDEPNGYSPLPVKMIIVTIEIQYHPAPHSITQGVSKAKLANSPYHIIISYGKMSDDQKEL